MENQQLGIRLILNAFEKLKIKYYWYIQGFQISKV